MDQWYYLEGSEQIGPMSEEQFQTKVQDGTVTPETLVWHQGMADWQAYGQVTSSQSSSPANSGQTLCPNCGAWVTSEDLVQVDRISVCPHCKEDYVQRIKEGLPPTGEHYDYGGFWIRFGAKFIDGLILSALQMVIGLLFTGSIAMTRNEAVVGVGFIFVQLLSFALRLGYSVFFIGKYQATPGKMACGLKVITEGGGQVSYARATGRHFAEILSSLILCIGYLMCIWDDEKRCLHDRICNTRVVRK